MKIFNTRCKEVATSCMEMFNFPLPSVCISNRKSNFLRKLSVSDNIICRLCAKIFKLVLTRFPDPNRSTAINFAHVDGRSVYIVDWRMVKVGGRNVLHHVKTEGEFSEEKCPDGICRGDMYRGEMSGSHVILPNILQYFLILYNRCVNFPVESINQSIKNF